MSEPWASCLSYRAPVSLEPAANGDVDVNVDLGTRPRHDAIAVTILPASKQGPA